MQKCVRDLFQTEQLACNQGYYIAYTVLDAITAREYFAFVEQGRALLKTSVQEIR